MKRSNVFFISAAIILGLTAIYWLIQALGLLLTGAAAGTYGLFLILAIIMVGLLLLSCRRPFLGGILIATLGILLSVYFLMVKLDLFAALPFLLLMCLPLTISGLLFIESDWSTRKKAV